MRRIRGKDTTIELILRKQLFARGYRFRKNDRRFPGTPDLVLPKYHTVIFVNGCFWHRHEKCKYSYIPKSNNAFWKKKFEDNIARDKRNYAALEKNGWKVLVVWECQLQKDVGKVVDQIEESLNSNSIISE